MSSILLNLQTATLLHNPTLSYLTGTMAYIHNALPYKQKQVLPPMLPRTTHPTTITRFEISLDTSQDPFNLSH